MAVFYKPSRPTAIGKEYENIQNEARKSKIGIWSDPSFEMPYEFRKKRNAEQN
jgi:endonuclease YncB( thermonuclease family)